MKKITDTVFYAGVDDHAIDLFEGQYAVPEGMSYNSYVVMDEKTAVFDTVDARFGHEWLDNLAEILGSRAPDYLVVTPRTSSISRRTIPRRRSSATRRPST